MPRVDPRHRKIGDVSGRVLNEEELERIEKDLNSSRNKRGAGWGVPDAVKKDRDWSDSTIESGVDTRVETIFPGANVVYGPEATGRHAITGEEEEEGEKKEQRERNKKLEETKHQRVNEDNRRRKKECKYHGEECAEHQRDKCHEHHIKHKN